MRLVVGITGATGIIYGVRLLEVLKGLNVEVHLVMSKWAEENLKLETKYTREYLESLVYRTYEYDELGASISSGSFLTKGMVIVPCSMKTLAGIANGYCDNLIQRAADVTLKEGRKLILVPRETPLNAIHLENMLKLTRLGVCIMPPMPAFYNNPKSLDDIINHQVARILDQFGLQHQGLVKRWGEN